MPKCKIHHKELVCPSCQAAKAGSVGGKARSEAKQKASRTNFQKAIKERWSGHRKAKAKPRKKADPHVWTLQDTLHYLEAHPDITLTAGTIASGAAPAKRTSAQLYAGQHLSALEKRKMVLRVTRGAYCFTPWRAELDAVKQAQQKIA